MALCPPRQESGDGSFHTNPASEGHCNTEIAWGEKTFPACLHAQQVLLCQKDKAPNPLICLLKFYQDFQHWKMHLWPGTVNHLQKVQPVRAVLWLTWGHQDKFINTEPLYIDLSAEKLIKVLPYGEKQMWFHPDFQAWGYWPWSTTLNTQRPLQQFNHLEKTWTHKTGGQRKQTNEPKDQNNEMKNYICAYIVWWLMCIQGLGINIPLHLKNKKAGLQCIIFIPALFLMDTFRSCCQQRLIHKEHVAATDKTVRAEMLQQITLLLSFHLDKKKSQGHRLAQAGTTQGHLVPSSCSSWVIPEHTAQLCNNSTEGDSKTSLGDLEKIVSARFWYKYLHTASALTALPSDIFSDGWFATCDLKKSYAKSFVFNSFWFGC